MAKKETTKKATIKKTTTKKSERTFSCIAVDVKSKTPIKLCLKTESDIANNPFVHFAPNEREEAKQYARNELLLIKDTLDWADYNERLWIINNYV